MLRLAKLSARASQMCQHCQHQPGQGRELEKIFAIDRAGSDSGTEGTQGWCDSEQRGYPGDSAMCS